MSAKQTPDSFWARVPKGRPDDCWEWQGSVSSSGYGNVSWHGQVVQAHRVAYYLSIGGVAMRTGFRQEGRAKSYRRFVLHRCDNRKCCNPAHLFLGSMSTNQKDAYAKGRKVQPRSKHANAKLTPAQVQEIRRAHAAGEVTQTALAVRYGVSQRAVSLVTRYESYKDI